MIALDLEPRDTELGAVIEKMRFKRRIQLGYRQHTAHEGPHIVANAEDPLPECITLASGHLNSALDLSLKYKNQCPHEECNECLRMVQRCNKKANYIEKSYEKLTEMVSFIEHLKTQSQNLIDDFLHICHTRQLVTHV